MTSEPAGFKKEKGKKTNTALKIYFALKAKTPPLAVCTTKPPGICRGCERIALPSVDDLASMTPS
jgi:hypothetical protein